MNLAGYQSNRPVYRSNRPVPKCAGRFEFALGFDRFLPVSGETGPVWGVRLGKKILLLGTSTPHSYTKHKLERLYSWW